ncbi:MAG TPA: DUF4416 family protein [Nitrospirota bacterium]|nr:DUF4416 family protein [Nitrospirota bacterium]
MAKVHPPIPVKLFVGMLSADPALFDECRVLLGEEYGATDLESPALPWDHTDYYEEEMGSGLLRKFIFFEKLIDPALLASVKKRTIGIEALKAVAPGHRVTRRINLDPGYVTEAKVVLASAKDFAHRIYIGEHLYAEVTLQYRVRDRTFLSLEHTYPDFRTKETIELFLKAREMLRKGLRLKPNPDKPEL